MKRFERKMRSVLISIGITIMIVIALYWLFWKLLFIGLDFATFYPTKPLSQEHLTRFIFILLGFQFITWGLILIHYIIGSMIGIGQLIDEYLKLRKWKKDDKKIPS